MDGNDPPERTLRIRRAECEASVNFGFHFADQVAREARTLAAINGVTANSYTVHSTIDVPLQRGVEAALQEGLSR